MLSRSDCWRWPRSLGFRGYSKREGGDFSIEFKVDRLERRQDKQRLLQEEPGREIRQLRFLISNFANHTQYPFMPRCDWGQRNSAISSILPTMLAFSAPRSPAGIQYSRMVRPPTWRTS